MTLPHVTTPEISADPATLEHIYRAQFVNGQPPEHRRVPFFNIRQLLSLNAKTNGRDTYMIFQDADGRRDKYDYAEFNVRVHQIANFLHDDLGVQRGDRVATLAYNHAETAMIYFACWVIGAAVAPQNVAEDDVRIAYILRSSEAVVCLVRPETLARARHIIESPRQEGTSPDEGLGVPNIRAIVQFGGEAQEGVLHLNTLVRNLPMTYMGDGANTKSTDDEIKNPNEASARLDDEALLVYTSGTTGAPKGVVLTQYNLLADAAAIAAAQGITGGQRFMCVLPIHHVNGIVVTLVTPMLTSASVVLMRSFSASTFWRTIAEDHVHLVSVVPTLLQFLLEHGRAQEAAGHGLFGEDNNRRGLTHFRHFICGAGTLSVALARDFEDTFGFPILHGYGLSETTCFSCFLPIDISWDEHQRWLQAHGYPSIGLPIGVNEMAIFAADGSGTRLGAGERGEICIRGHNVMKYYDKRPEANAETFRFDWFRSGDEGFYLEDERGRQFFFISGRIKELINRGGVKFSPFDIEEVLLGVPGVKAALAVGFANDYYGEEVGAYVVPQDGVTLDAEAVLAHCRERLTFEKSPKVVLFGTDIPVTTTGKYQRLKLQPLFAEWAQTQFRKP